jgi:dihydroorotate dehydrogenase
VFVKLPPFVTAVERDVVLTLARIAQEAGAHGLTCANTRPVGEPRLATGSGGLSGRALWPETVAIVAAVREATGEALTVNACGGISTADDVFACLEAGAATVQIYSALIYEGPGIVGALTTGLADRLRRRGLVISDLVGTANPG